MSDTTTNKVMVWDLPVRVFHWTLVLSFVMAWLSYDDGRYLDVHVFSGYTFFALLLFRLVWGVVGTHYARFREFLYGPREVFAYARGLFSQGLQRYVGHNPAGAWAIFALISFGLVLTLSGLFVLGGEERQGPLAGVIGFDSSMLFREVHEFAAWSLLVLVGGHVLGVIVESLLHRENLVGAMLRGTKWVAGESASVPAHYLLGVAIVTAVLAWGAVSFGGYLSDTTDKPYLPFKGPALVDNAVWRTECSDCHLAFHPSLLPARSWQRMLAEQDNHFDEDLMLDEDVIAELSQFLTKNAAEQQATEAAWRISRSVPTNQAPLKITETEYWKSKHNEISDVVWRSEAVRSKANCAACHLDAEQGTFEDSAMKLPGQTRGPDLSWLMVK